jgi:hypothetical protein
MLAAAVVVYTQVEVMGQQAEVMGQVLGRRLRLVQTPVLVAAVRVEVTDQVERVAVES